MMTEFLGKKTDPRTEPWSSVTSRGQEEKEESAETPEEWLEDQREPG